MSHKISHLAHVDSRAELGDDVEIGPFCSIGPNVQIGNGTRLDSHVTIIGHTSIGERNRFWPNCVIGAEPQDIGYKDTPTRTEIGDDNQFREGVTVNRGAEKEDHVTRIGDRNLLMSNAHVAHNCFVQNRTILVNGVLLGGHVHVQDGAIISGNSVVHHFSTVGRLAFVGGASRIARDVPPYMLGVGCDNFEISTINLIGLRRNGISNDTINAIKRAHRLVYREHRNIEEARNVLLDELEGVFPLELSFLFNFLELQQRGKMGRGREVFRDAPQKPAEQQRRRAA
ncbi:MAG: acyl-ACP--UDP-N-acetylglucosamine O-acyltransferase [Planctomycetaceae bacterium]